MRGCDASGGERLAIGGRATAQFAAIPAGIADLVIVGLVDRRIAASAHRIGRADADGGVADGGSLRSSDGARRCRGIPSPAANTTAQTEQGERRNGGFIR